MKLTSAQYLALLNLYHECNEAFMTLGDEWKQAFYDRLFTVR